MTTAKFNVERSLFPHINKLMRAADLCEGIEVNGESSANDIFTITWKDGVVVDDTRKQATKDNLKNAIESLGYDCYAVFEVE